MTPAWRHSRRQGGRALLTTKEQNSGCGGRGGLGPQLGRGSLCLCGHVLLVVEDDERDEADRTRVRDSPHTPQETPSLPSPETATYCYAIHRRLELLESAGFWVDSGLSLSARGWRHSRQGGRALPTSRRPKAPLEPAGRSPPSRGQRGRGADSERGRAGARARADRRSERRARAAAGARPASATRRP